MTGKPERPETQKEQKPVTGALQIVTFFVNILCITIYNELRRNLNIVGDNNI